MLSGEVMRVLFNDFCLRRASKMNVESGFFLLLLRVGFLVVGDREEVRRKKKRMFSGMYLVLFLV